MASKNFIRIREIFDSFFPDAKKDASDNAALSIKQIEAECNNAEQLVCMLHQEEQAIKADIDSFETKEYYCWANNESIIFLIYCSRIFLYDKDEKQAIRLGLNLSERYRQVNARLLKAKKRLPLFLSSHFHLNKKNVVFYELDEQPFGTPDKDYLEMRMWQLNRNVHCITMEFDRLRQNFISVVTSEQIQMEELQREINQLGTIFDNVRIWSGEHFFVELYKLNGLNGLVLPEDKQGFHQLIISFCDGNKLNFMLNPKFFETTAHDIKRGIISSPPIFPLTLLMYGRWLCDVFSGIEEIKSHAKVSLDDLFGRTCHAGHELGQNAIEKFKNKKRKRKLTSEEYYRELKQECIRQYQLYQKLEYPDYFYLLEQKERLKIGFINDCLKSIYIDLPVSGLMQVVAFNEMLEFLLDEMIMHEVEKAACENEFPYDKQLAEELFCYLAPDSKLLKQLLKLLAMVSRNCHNEQMPLCFIQEELATTYEALIKKAEKIYTKKIGIMDIELRGYYVTEQLRNLKHLARFQDLDNNPLSTVYKQIKKIYKDELKTAHELQCFHPSDNDHGKQMKGKNLDKPFNFGYRQGPKELEPILNAVDLKMNMLTNGSTVKDLMEVFTCKDLRKNKKRIYVGFTTIKFTYLRKKLEPWFSFFTPANIERSGIFISSKDEPITAHVLYNSTAILWEDSHLMDSIFDANY